MSAPERWALVTGAGSGIGCELAVQLATQGYGLLLVGLDEESLARTAARIAAGDGKRDAAPAGAAGKAPEECPERACVEPTGGTGETETEPTERGGTEPAAGASFEAREGCPGRMGSVAEGKTAPITPENKSEESAAEIAAGSPVKRSITVPVRWRAIDLARTEAAREVWEWCRTEGVEVEVLVNNAGSFSYCDVVRTDPTRIERLTLLHDLTPALLCRLFGEQMMERGRGAILNLSSYSIWMAWPGMALYSASKAYLRTFSRAFAREAEEAGVQVTAVCPAGVATDLYGLPPRLQRLGCRLGVLLTPERCARKALHALRRGRRVYVPGWGWRLLIPLLVAMPGPILRFIRRRTASFQR